MTTAVYAGPLYFEKPHYALLLFVLPLLVYMAIRSLGGLGGVRWALALALRVVVVVLLIATLAGPAFVQTVTDQVVVFAIDLSASIPRAQQDVARLFLRSASAAARAGRDRIAVVSFADDAQVEQLPRERLELERLAGPARRVATNISDALRLSQAMFLPDSARRIVLISDGNENVGDVRAIADAAAGAGIPVDVLPLRYSIDREVLVESVVAPAAARLEETVALSVTLRATSRTRGQLRLYQNDTLVDLEPDRAETARPIHLDEGVNRLTLPIPLRSTGAHRFRVVFEPLNSDDDGRVQNNEGRAFTLVSGPQRVLVLEDLGRDRSMGDEESAGLLVESLRRQQIECDLLDAASNRISSELLSAYGAVVLSNVPAVALGPDGERILAASVREFGLGLIMVGGDQSFTVGGYHESPVGDILPVETSRQKLQLPTLGQIFVMDRSGSMMGLKLMLSKHAARSAVALLNSRDFVGVVAFDTAPEWVVPFQRCGRREAVDAAIGHIGIGGGTDMHPALAQAIDALERSETAFRHIVLLTDGRTEPGPFEALATRMEKAGITCSSVAIGDDVDRALLTMLATRSGGRPYFVNDANSVPQIFARETVLAGRAALYERPFTPQVTVVGRDAVLAGVNQRDIPPLEGHVVTAARSLATVALSRPTEDGSDPILAYWQVGTGRTVAFTGGMWPRWGAAWVAWPGFGAFWAQAVRWVARAPASDVFEVSSRIADDRVSVVIEPRDAIVVRSGSLQWAGKLLDPDANAQDLAVVQIGPGRYEARFDAHAEGTYFLNLAFASDTPGAEPAVSGVVRTGVTVPYAREHASLRENEMLIEDIARRTGGRVLDARRPAEVFKAASIQPVQTMQPIWDLLVRIALVCFLADVAVRRVALSPRAIINRLRGFLAPAPTAAPVAATLKSLREVRNQTRVTQTAPRGGRGRSARPTSESGEAGRLPTDVTSTPDLVEPQSERPAATLATQEVPAGRLDRLRAARDRARDTNRGPDTDC